MKKTIVCILAVLTALCLFAACGKTPPAGGGDAVDPASVKTLGDVIALEGKQQEQKGAYENVCIFAFELNGDYWRAIAPLTAEQSEAVFELDWSDDEKVSALLSPIAVSKTEKLTDQKLSDAEMAALVGKTGAELLDDGFVSGMGHNLDSMEFWMERGPFAYTVVFETEEKLENTDDFDEEEAIRTLKVKSVSCDGLGAAATDLPEE